MKVVLGLTGKQGNTARNIAKDLGKIPRVEYTVWHGDLYGYVVPKRQPGQADYMLSLDGNKLVYDGPRDIIADIWHILDAISGNGSVYDMPVLYFSDEFPFQKTEWYHASDFAIRQLMLEKKKFRQPELRKALEALNGGPAPQWLVTAGTQLLRDLKGMPKAGTPEYRQAAAAGKLAEYKANQRLLDLFHKSCPVNQLAQVLTAAA